MKINPRLLQLNRTISLVPKLEWCRHRLDLRQEGVERVLSKAPSIFTYSIDDKLEPFLSWFQNRLNLEDYDLRRCILRYPTLFHSSPSTLKTNLQWLQKVLVLDNDELSKMIVYRPDLLYLSLASNLEPTLIFYKMCLGDDEAVAFLRRNPPAFAASLEKRLRPRLRQLEDLGVPIDPYAVRLMIYLSEKKWLDTLGQSGSTDWRT